MSFISWQKSPILHVTMTSSLYLSGRSMQADQKILFLSELRKLLYVSLYFCDDGSECLGQALKVFLWEEAAFCFPKAVSPSLPSAVDNIGGTHIVTVGARSWTWVLNTWNSLKLLERWKSVNLKKFLNIRTILEPSELCTLEHFLF